MEALGIPDEDEIIRQRMEREERLKGEFNTADFQERYEKELKRRADKKKKLEEDKAHREREQYTF